MKASCVLVFLCQDSFFHLISVGKQYFQFTHLACQCTCMAVAPPIATLCLIANFVYYFYWHHGHTSTSHKENTHKGYHCVYCCFAFPSQINAKEKGGNSATGCKKVNNKDITVISTTNAASTSIASAPAIPSRKSSRKVALTQKGKQFLRIASQRSR